MNELTTNQINDIYADLRTYLLKRARRVCFYLETAEDIVQAVLVDLLPELDLSHSQKELRNYALYKLNNALRDEYRVIRATGIQYKYECPTSFDLNMEDEESDVGNNKPETHSMLTLAVDQDSKDNFVFGNDFNERPDPFLNIEYDSVCTKVRDSLDGHARSIMDFLIKNDGKENSTEVATAVGITRQYVEYIMQKEICPKLKKLIFA